MARLARGLPQASARSPVSIACSRVVPDRSAFGRSCASPTAPEHSDPMRYDLKEELIADADAQHDALLGVLGQIPESACVESGVWGDDWSVADLLSHLAEWHVMLLGWWREGQEGSTPAMPAPGFKWNETPRLNRAIQARYHGRSYALARDHFEATHAEVVALMRELSQADLFEAGRFEWTGKNALVTYIGANTASHYRFAQKVIKRWQRVRVSNVPSQE